MSPSTSNAAPKDTTRATKDLRLLVNVIKCSLTDIQVNYDDLMQLEGAKSMGALYLTPPPSQGRR